MQRIFQMKLVCRDCGDTVADAVARLRALRHRTLTCMKREYHIPGGIVARAMGANAPLVAWKASKVTSTSAGLEIEDRRNYPPPYIEWPHAAVVETAPVTDILITNKLCIRVTGEAGHERVHAELTGDGDRGRHLDALDAVCGAAGFMELDAGTRREIVVGV